MTGYGSPSTRSAQALKETMQDRPWTDQGYQWLDWTDGAGLSPEAKAMAGVTKVSRDVCSLVKLFVDNCLCPCFHDLFPCCLTSVSGPSRTPAECHNMESLRAACSTHSSTSCSDTLTMATGQPQRGGQNLDLLVPYREHQGGGHAPISINGGRNSNT